ncbi:MAG TPA: biotin transporter BioY [Methanomicrobiales archaeon]|jgi:biotin transport system substrate-specific component|nr:biotin transporter BioY [Methanomicrobiales archaeon]
MHGNPERTALLAGTATFIALLAAGAWVAIPVGPVPVTLQTFFLLLSAPVLKRHAVVPAALYLLLGALNLPVFHAGLSGIGVLLGPSGGFLVGFVPAAAVAGLAYESRSRAVRIAGLAGATAVIYACGAGWLLLSAGLTLPAALLVGVLPFLPGDALKSAGVFLLGERLA